MTRHQPTGRLVGLGEIRRLLGGISRQRAHQITEHAKFPAAYDVVDGGKFWCKKDVEKWIQENRKPTEGSGVPTS